MTPSRIRNALRRLLDALNRVGYIAPEQELTEARAALAEEEREDGELVGALREIATIRERAAEANSYLGIGDAYAEAKRIASAIIAKHPSPPKAGDGS